MEAKGDEAWQPDRDRHVTAALKAYAAMTTSASKGAVREVPTRTAPPVPSTST
jgi:dihydroxy-acid dehydratase